MKQYGVHIIIRGQQVRVMVITTSRKKAVELINDATVHRNLTAHHMKTYGYCVDAKNTECIENPEIPFAYLDGGDESLWSKIGLRKVIKLSDMKSKIDKIRDKQYEKFKRKFETPVKSRKKAKLKFERPPDLK